MLLTCVESSPQSGGPCDLRETVTIPSRRRDMCGYSRLLDLMCACRFIETQSLPPSILQVSPNRRRSTGFNHDIHQPPYARSHISFPASHSIPRPRTASGQSTPISTRDAVFGEVIEEEYRATESRLRDEAQSEKLSAAPSTRSWLTSWMYAKVPWNL